MNRSFSTTLALALIIVFLLLVNLVGSMVFRHSRIDLTSEKLYTLSEGTRNILDKLEDNLRFKLYVTEGAVSGLPGIKLYVNRVREMLEEYEKVSGGRVTLATLDPRPDTEEEELAQKYGLQAVPLQGGESLYFGLVISDESGNDEVIQFFSPDREKYLEYDISKAVVNVSSPEKEVVGILSSLPVMGQAYPPGPPSSRPGDTQPWALVSQLRQLYTVRDVPADTSEIGDDIDILLLIHPKDLSPETKLAVDQYLLKGGRVIAFVDPNCEADSPPPDPQNPYAEIFYDRASQIPELLASWGLDMDSEKLAADLNLAANVRTASFEVVPYPVYLNLGSGNINEEEVIAGGIDNLIFPTAGVLKPAGKREGLELVPLIQTTDSGNTIVKEPFMEPEKVIKEFSGGKSKLTLAYRVSGKFRTAFPEGITASDDDEGKKTMPQLTESGKESTVIVFADADFISDRFSARVTNFFGQKIISLINDNINLAFNAVEAMAGSQDLIGIRSRGKFERPFTRVARMEAEAQEKWRAKEAELQAKLEELEKKLNELQSRKGDEYSGRILTAAQLSEIGKFRTERLSYQKQLREVRKNLREDVERLHRNLKLINTWLMPLLIAAVTLAVHFARQRRRA